MTRSNIYARAITSASVHLTQIVRGAEGTDTVEILESIETDPRHPDSSEKHKAAVTEALERHRRGTVLKMVQSTSDERTVNNAVRHQYRVLTDEEKELMQTLKDHGADFIKAMTIMIDSGAYDDSRRELDIAVRKVEEATMWAVKGLTK